MSGQKWQMGFGNTMQRQRTEKMKWIERTDRLGRKKLECHYDYFGKDRLLGVVTYHPENFDKKWEVFAPGPHIWETYQFKTEEEAKSFVTRRLRQESYASKYTVKGSCPEYMESRLMGSEI